MTETKILLKLLLLLILAIVSGASYATNTSAIWNAETIGITLVGADTQSKESSPIFFYRQVSLVVIGPDQVSATDQEKFKICIKSAFDGTENGKVGRDKISDQLKRLLDEVAAESVPDNKIKNSDLRVQDLIRVHKNTVNRVDDAVKQVTITFANRLLTPACSGIPQTRLALIQRVCPIQRSAEGNTCQLNEARKKTLHPSGFSEDQAAKRADILFDWAGARSEVAATGSLTTLYVPDSPVVLEVDSTKPADSTKLLEAFSANSTIWVKPPSAQLAQAQFEKLVRLMQVTPNLSNKKIATLAPRVIDLPREVAVRTDGRINNLSHVAQRLRSDPKATLEILSDEIARSRLKECGMYKGTVSLNEISTCAGYEFNENLIRDCMVKNPCRPVLTAQIDQYKYINFASAEQSDRKSMALNTPLPRLATIMNTKMDVLIGSASQCKKNGTDGLAECLIEKLPPDIAKVQKCASDSHPNQKTKESSESLRPAELILAANCIKPGVAKTLTPVIDCANGSDFAKCAVKTQIGTAGNALISCTEGGPKQISSLVECYARSQNSEESVLKIANLVNCQSKAKNNADYIKCIAPSLGKDATAIQTLIQCANGATDNYSKSMCLLGDKIPPGVGIAVKCYQESAGNWTKMAICGAAPNFPADVSEVMGCLTQNGGDPFGSTACVAANRIGLNAEGRIALQCAASTGGVPPAWAACTFGQLTLKELGNCRGKKYGEGECFGENNFFRKELGIGPNNELARLVNIHLDVVNGMVAFVQNPGATTQKTVENAVNELNIVRSNVAKTVEDAARKSLGEGAASVVKAVDRGVYIKVELPPCCHL